MKSGSSKTLKYLLVLSCFVISITNLTACSQVHASSDLTTPETPAASAKPVAYVYVSQQPTTSGPNQVLGYSVATNGKLTPITGSPFTANVDMMAVNGKYLFGSSADGLTIDSYTIEPNGQLAFKASNDVGALTGNTNSSGGTNWLALDHTGATLYQEWVEAGNLQFYYNSFAVDKNTGTLTVTKNFGGPSLDSWSALAIAANDQFVYGTVPFYDADWTVNLIERDSYGSLHSIKEFPVTIVPPPGESYMPTLVAADPTNHLAVCMNPLYTSSDGVDGGAGSGPLAVFTEDAEGNLTTESTAENMPKVLESQGCPTLMRTSPSGKLLATGGDQGLQVFHFNGAEPITPYATLVKNIGFTDLRWDNANHLFALAGSVGDNELYVLTVTPTSITQVPGSPYSIPEAQGLIVQPLPL